MPWVRKHRQSTNGNWIVGIVAGVLFGLFLGYEWWGSTAAVVTVVEKELNSTESHITNLESRVIQLESRLVSQEGSRVVVEENGAEGKRPSDLTEISSKGISDTARPRAENH